MSGDRYLKDRLGLYLLLAVLLVLFAAIVLLLPYETVYVRNRTYLSAFLITIIACVVVFTLGITYNALLWMRGSGLVGTPEQRLLKLLPRALAFMCRRFGKTLSVFAKDAVYLSRLKSRSLTRWSMHLLILGGFILMFLLDLITTFSLDIVRYGPMMQDNGWAKLWIRDFGFDLAGAAMLVGLVIAFARRFVLRSKIVRTELPDAVSVIFLMAVVAGGFVLEGMGIAGRIPGHESHQIYSFLGYAISLAMPSSAGQYYDQAWLIHGVMSALLIAYVPFSKLFHMIATPIAIEADKMLPSGVGH